MGFTQSLSNNTSFCSQTLKHLLEELKKIKVDPDEVRIPGQLYDDFVDDAEDIAEEAQLKKKVRRLLPWIRPVGGMFRNQRGRMV
jgi:hypothetical protein